MKKILALHTGGTISMSASNDKVKTNEENPLLDTQFINENIDLANEVVLNKPSEHITPEDMLVIKKRVKKAIDNAECDGIVITHGTDTLEETAYFLDLTVPSVIPIVLTGAMRSSNELGSDGVYNFQSAILTAASDEAKGKGVLVVMNDEIHTARFVTKTHTTNVDTFRTPTFGPLGIVYKRDIRFFQALISQQVCDIDQLVDDVYLVKAYAGIPGSIFEALDRPETKGVVIEGLGAGNLPVEVVEPIQRLIKKGIPVVMVSRCYNGLAEPIYDYVGGGIDLERMGVIFCQGLNGQKARIKLQVGLSNHMNGKEIAHYMHDAVS
ncbi:asparaginase [Pediococcus acidilactici]